MASIQLQPTLSMDIDQHTLQISGAWVMESAHHLEKLMTLHSKSIANGVMIHTIDASQLSRLDTNGAWYLLQLYSSLKVGDATHTITISNLNPRAQHIYEQIALLAKQTVLSSELHKKENKNFLVGTGEYTVQFLLDIFYFLNFVGHVLVQGLFSRAGLKDWSFRNVLVIVEQMGLAAVPIVGLLSFLIGVVLCYQMGLQLQEYNANIFIVDLSGLAILREFGPLITALIAAARTSTAFSSEIGAMKINDELDALTTMGISPLSRLVVPKVIGLVLALPLLTILADAAGIFGSMVMSQNLLSIHFNDFAVRFRQVVEMSSFWLGLRRLCLL